jgi:hypothetical protein
MPLRTYRVQLLLAKPKGELYPVTLNTIYNGEKFMKMTLASLILVLMSAPAFAGTASYTAAENFAVPSATADAECTQLSSMLSQISTPELNVSVEQNCVMSQRHSKFVVILTRVLVDAASWGVNEIACKKDHQGLSCGENDAYLSLRAHLVVSDTSGAPFQGKPVSMSASDCQTYAAALSELTLSSKQAKLTATCNDGMLQTSLSVTQ